MLFRKPTYLMAFGWLLVCAMSSGPARFPEKFAVVANGADVPALSSDKLKDIFYGATSYWSNGTRVELVVLAKDVEGSQLVTQAVLGWSMDEFVRHWLRLTFQGRGNPPVFVNSNAALIEYVKRHKGAVGVVVDTSSLDGVDVIEISDK